MFAARDAEEYLLPTERRVIRVRRHWACLLWDLFEAIGLFAGIVMLSYVLPKGTVIVQNILWYAALFVLLRFAYYILEWYVERIVVTDKRFMIIEGIITRSVQMMPVSKVTDLTYKRSFAARLLGYGTLVVESAGQIQALNEIEYLPNPEQIFDGISALVFGEKKTKPRFPVPKAARESAQG